MKKSIFFLIIPLLLSLFAISQPEKLAKLHIGYKVPEVLLDSMMNDNNVPHRLSGFKEELIILDFWNTWCSSCVAGFPLMDSLQNEFKGNLKILLVNTQSKLTGDNIQKINTTLQKLYIRTGINITMPIVYNNESLDLLFPCITIPHEVWIKQGKVIAITYAEAVTRSNITAALSNTKVRFPVKEDILDFNDSLPLFVRNNGGAGEQTIFRSLLSADVNGLSGKTSYRFRHLNDSTTTCIGFFAYKQSIPDLLRIAWPELMKHPDKRICIESALQYFKPVNDQEAKQLFYYDLSTPPMSDSMMVHYLREDLQRYFPLKISSEQRTAECWTLSKNKKAGDRKSLTSADSSYELQAGSAHKYIRRMSAGTVAWLLDKYVPVNFLSSLPDTDLLTIELPQNLDNFQDMADAFRKAGYTLTQETKPIQMTIISDN